MVYIWLIIVIILIFIEAITIDLVSIWFIASGILALISTFITGNVTIQVAIFVVVGVILLLTTRKFLKKLLEVKPTSTNLDRIIGTTGIVKEDIEKNSTGLVKVDGKIWTAYSNKEIKKNAPVIIEKIEGTKLKVIKKEGE